jgi:ketosteroid isomerase-like protein
MDDYRAILELTHRYALYNDTKQIDELVDLWIDGAIWDPSPDTVSPRCDGKAEIRMYFEKLFSVIESASHFVSNHIVEIEDDRARGSCYWATTGLTVQGIMLDARGRYDDGYERSGGVWRFACRRSTPFGYSKVTKSLMD